MAQRRDTPADDKRKWRNRFRRGRKAACDVCECFTPCDVCDVFLLGRFLSRYALSVPDRRPRPQPSGPGRVGMLMIGGYQRWVTQWLPTACRHTPTCSAYGREAVRRYGLVTGSRLTLGRIRRCTAAVPHGTLDPVP